MNITKTEQEYFNSIKVIGPKMVIKPFPLTSKVLMINSEERFNMGIVMATKGEYTKVGDVVHWSSDVFLQRVFIKDLKVSGDDDSGKYVTINEDTVVFIDNNKTDSLKVDYEED